MSLSVSKLICYTVLATAPKPFLAAEEPPLPPSGKQEGLQDESGNFTLLFKNYVDGYGRAQADKNIHIVIGAIKPGDDFKVAREKLIKAYNDSVIVDGDLSLTIVKQLKGEDKKIIFFTVTDSLLFKDSSTYFGFQLSISSLHTVLYQNLDLLRKKLTEKPVLTEIEYLKIILQTIELEIKALNRIISDENVPEKLQEISKTLLKTRTEQCKIIKRGVRDKQINKTRKTPGRFRNTAHEKHMIGRTLANYNRLERPGQNYH